VSSRGLTESKALGHLVQLLHAESIKVFCVFMNQLFREEYIACESSNVRGWLPCLRIAVGQAWDGIEEPFF
jgi:hypothetical protein